MRGYAADGRPSGIGQPWAILAVVSAAEGQSAAEADVAMVRALAVLFAEADVAVDGAREFLEKLDTRRGKPDEKCIRVTSIFKAKGLEWEHVLLPDLVERQCPDLRAQVTACVNEKDPDRAISPTETLESERRLFYVAVTRAKSGMYLYADSDEDRLVSRFIHEALVRKTFDAVEGLQAILSADGEDHREALYRIRDAAVADKRLRNGLLTMLRRESDEEGVSKHYSRRSTRRSWR